MTALPRVMVAPNGARRTKADHPALPMTLPEIVETTRACRQAGADGLHLHLRNAEGRHILDTGLYREALAELRSAVPDMALQITTEAVGLYDAAHQREVALTSNASLVSASIREMTTDTPDTTARAFYEDCAAHNIAIQHILYDPQEFDLLARILPPDLLQTPDLQLIFVLGRYSEVILPICSRFCHNLKRALCPRIGRFAPLAAAKPPVWSRPINAAANCAWVLKTRSGIPMAALRATMPSGWNRCWPPAPDTPPHRQARSDAFAGHLN